MQPLCDHIHENVAATATSGTAGGTGPSDGYRSTMASPLVRAVGARDRVVDTGAASLASVSSPFCVLSHHSLFSVGSVGSLGAAGSILSIGSAGSLLSIGSVGSILSIGSTGSILSIGSAGSVRSIGEGRATSDQPGVARIDGDRLRSAAVGRTLALLALAAAALGR